MNPQFFIDSSDDGLSRDDAGHSPLPRYIGPFPTREDAEAYIRSLQPLWGSYTIPALTRPEEVSS